MACVDIYQALTEDRPYKKDYLMKKHVISLMTWHRKILLIRIFQKIIREMFWKKTDDI